MFEQIKTRKSVPWRKTNANKNKIFYMYRNEAKRRGFSFLISKEEFEKFIDKNCYYCDRAPENNCSVFKNHKPFIYNGIDRKDNSIGYVIDNIVTCCKWCNTRKKKKSYNNFILEMLQNA